jgi:hypothetical protein
MTLWSPDTCGCKIEYDDNIQVTKVHLKCAKHASTPDDGTHLAVVLAHNRKKNMVFNAITMRGAKAKGLSVSYDANDDLHVTGDGLIPANRSLVLTDVTSALGASKLNWDS